VPFLELIWSRANGRPIIWMSVKVLCELLNLWIRFPPRSNDVLIAEPIEQPFLVENVFWSHGYEVRHNVAQVVDVRLAHDETNRAAIGLNIRQICQVTSVRGRVRQRTRRCFESKENIIHGKGVAIMPFYAIANSNRIGQVIGGYCWWGFGE